MTARELAGLRDKVKRAELGLEQPRHTDGTYAPKPATSITAGAEPLSDPRYPVTGRASILECPVHLLIVALDEAGRIKSACPDCVAEADAAMRLVAA